MTEPFRVAVLPRRSAHSARSRRLRCFACTVLLLALASVSGLARGQSVAWQPLTESTFTKAAAEGRLVFLELEAVWCHWCHVLDAKTWTDPDVRALMEAHFLPVRVDSDARPDLATRYRDWGWPALIVLAPDGTEIVKRAGFIEPAAMARMLRAIVRDPTPEAAARAPDPQPATSHLLTAALRTELERRDRTQFDPALGGLAIAHKFLDRDSVEWALMQAAAGDAAAAERARRTLDAARALVDPAWGGVYQYSTGGRWDRPHFEKLAHIQAAYLRTYALAWALWHDPRDRQVALTIIGYVRRFLTDPDGGIRASQDADRVPGEHAADYFALGDTERLARGVPRVDPNVWTDDTGLWIEALAVWAEASGDADALAEARRPADWVARTRSLGDGLHRHGAADAGGFLSDDLAMARARLALYRATADRHDLAAAIRITDAVLARYRHDAAGVLPTDRRDGPIAVQPDPAQNLAFARLANRLAAFTGAPRFRAAAEDAMRLLASPDVALARITEPGILIADRELGRDPLHVTIVGAKSDADAVALFASVRGLPGDHRRTEWWDRSEGPLPNPDVRYPVLPRAAAFVCTDRVCSVPLYAPADVAAFLARRLPTAARPVPGA